GSREPPTFHEFNLSDVKAATNKFLGHNLLESGGFRPVYKGILLGGELIAVKRLLKSSTQGLAEFTNEVSLNRKASACEFGQDCGVLHRERRENVGL
ncbi:unnamed protein product, partial [Linum tenue]